MPLNTHSLDLEASSLQYVSIADGSQTGLDLSGSMTLEMWLKPETIGVRQVLISKYDATANQQAYIFSIAVNNKLTASFNDGTNQNGYTTNDFQIVTAGIWWYVAMSFDISTEACVFYVGTPTSNPAVVPSAQDTGTSLGASLRNSTSPFIIGCGVDNTTNFSDSFDGLINNVRVWSDVRSSAEIIANYRSGNPVDGSGNLITPGTENLVDGWYNGNNHNSLSGNNNLTATSGPVFVSETPFDSAIRFQPTYSEAMYRPEYVSY